MENKILKALVFEKKHDVKGRLYHYTQVHMTYNSNYIEGNKLTEDQVRMIFEIASFIPHKNEPINTNDILETVNHFDLFNYMIDTIGEALSQELIKKFHDIIKRGTSDSRLPWYRIGDYKLFPNEVAGIATSAPENVAAEMENLIREYPDTPSLEEIVEFHVAFERIHPFQDGNGRVGRMIMFRECLRNNIMPIIIEETYKVSYYTGLKEFLSKPEHLISICRNMQDIYSKKLSQLKI